MKHRLILLTSLLVVGALTLNPAISGAVPIAPGEQCFDVTTADNWTLEVCGAVAAAGIGTLTEHVGECRMTAVDPPTHFAEGDGVTTRVVIATGIRTCQFYKNGAPLGSNQRAAVPADATTVAVNLGLQSTGTITMCLEGFALFSNADELTVSNLSTCPT